MAQEKDLPKSADKGKGKAVGAEKSEDAKKGKDAPQNGKKDEEKIIDGKAHPEPSCVAVSQDALTRCQPRRSSVKRTSSSRTSWTCSSSA